MDNDIKLSYKNALNKRFYDNKKKLLESFIEYYGEEYRNRINSIYDDTIIVYYIGQNITDLINSYNIYELELNPQERGLFELENKLAKNSNLTDNEKRRIRYIGSNRTDIFNDDELSEITNTIITRSKTNTYKKLLWTFNGRTNRFIFIPSYMWEDSPIIHEMNHNMTSEELLLIESEKYNSYVSRSGLNIDNDNAINSERIIEELINEMSSIEITKIFHSKKGTYVEPNLPRNIQGTSLYRENFYLVEKFYTYFKDVIKKARISGNKNLLLQTCGKVNYYKLVNLVNKYYDETGYTLERAMEVDKVFEEMRSYNRAEDEIR